MAREKLRALTLTPNEARAQGITINFDGKRRNAIEVLAYDGVDFAKLRGVWPELAEITPQVAEQMEIEAQYAGYLDRQEADIVAFRKDEDMRLPVDLDYRAIGGLSNEAKDKLSTVRPATLGQAARIEGADARSDHGACWGICGGRPGRSRKRPRGELASDGRGWLWTPGRGSPDRRFT